MIKSEYMLLTVSWEMTVILTYTLTDRIHLSFFFSKNEERKKTYFATLRGSKSTQMLNLSNFKVETFLLFLVERQA